MLVLDATPLIYLATVGRLDVLDALDEPCAVPQPVYDGVVTAGLEAGHVNARRVERAVEDKTLTVQPAPESELGDRLRSNPNLAGADVVVIALAASEDAVAVMDERYGRSTAGTERVDTSGTMAILGAAIRNEHLSGAEAIDLVDDMIDAGWYCSTDVYTRIVRAFDELNQDQ